MPDRVLIVDDEALLTELSKEILSLQGYQVRIAEDGAEALDVTKNWLPDVVLLDLGLPDMDGFEVCRRLRKNSATAYIPVIVVSGSNEGQDKILAFEVGADDYIEKPYDHRELVVRVKAQLQRFARFKDHVGQSTTEGKTVVCFSLRGGSGCTSLAVNLAAGFSNMWGVETPLVDLVTPIGSCDLMLNMRSRLNIKDLITSDAKEDYDTFMQDVMLEHESGVLLLGGFKNPEDADLLTEKAARKILERLPQYYPYVVVDTSHDFSPATLAALDIADAIVVPISPDISSLRVTLSMLRTFTQLGYPKEIVTIIPNWTFAVNGLSNKQIERSLKHPVHDPILHDNDWVMAANRGEPVIVNSFQTKLTSQLENLVWELSRDEHRESAPEEPTEMWSRVSHRWKYNRF